MKGQSSENSSDDIERSILDGLQCFLDANPETKEEKKQRLFEEYLKSKGHRLADERTILPHRTTP